MASTTPFASSPFRPSPVPFGAPTARNTASAPFSLRLVRVKSRPSRFFVLISTPSFWMAPISRRSSSRGSR